MPTPTTYKVISPSCLFDDFPMVYAFIDAETRRWKADLVRSLFLPFEANTILNMPLSYNLPEDKIIGLAIEGENFLQRVPITLLSKW